MCLANAILGPFPQPFLFWCDPIVLEFCFGMFIALAYVDGWRVAPRVGLALLIVGALGFAVSLHPVVDQLPRTIKWGIPGAAVMTGVVLGGLLPKPGRIGRLFVALGDASYALYLVHVLVILVFSSTVVYFRINFGPWGWFYIAALTATSVAAAIVVHRAFERPVTRALRAHSFTGGRSRGAGQGEASLPQAMRGTS
jgi:peptidoglycan/LPS O-acetylase OafA/YrhL